MICLKTDCVIYPLLAITLISVINPENLGYQLFDMDEIWNYQWARHMLYGNIPSTFMPLIPFPFSSQINGSLLSVFGDKLIVMRWVACVIAVLNGLIAFRILRIMGQKHLTAFFYTMLFLCPFVLYPQNNYSWYAVLFLTITLLLEINKIRDEKSRQLWYELWIGIFLGIVTITKQNIGIAGLGASIVFLIYYNRFQIQKSFIQNIIIKLVGWSTVLVFEILYLSQDMGPISLTGRLIASLTSFTQFASIPYSTILFSDNIILRILGFAIPLLLIFSIVKGICTDYEVKKHYIILTSLYAVANFFMVLPLADWAHLNLGIPLTVLAIAGAFKDTTYFDEIKQKKQFIVIILTIMIFCVGLCFANIHERTEPEVKHYESIYLPIEAKQKIIDVDNYILAEEAQGRKVLFLDFSASLYLIPIDKFGYLYDGIVGPGSLAEREIIEILQSSKNVTAIIRGMNMSNNRQETTKVREYVRQNMRFETTIHHFDVYHR